LILKRGINIYQTMAGYIAWLSGAQLLMSFAASAGKNNGIKRMTNTIRTATATIATAAPSGNAEDSCYS
jgi:hypothetical protein